MSSDRDLRPDPEMESQINGWLSDSDLSPSEAETGLDRFLVDFPVTPQARRRFLGRWFDRGEGARRRADDHDHPPDQPRRTRLMFSATGIVAALAVLALAVNVVNTQAPPPSVGSGTGYTVAADGSGDFQTISEAVEAAADGDIVVIGPGTYTESIVIDKDITLTGDTDDPGAVVVVIPEGGPMAEFGTMRLQYAFWLQDATADVGNLTIRGPGATVSAFVIDGGEPIIHDIVEELDEYRMWPHGFAYIQGDGAGVIRDNVTKAFFWLEGSTAPTITGNRIANVIRNNMASAARIENNEVGGIWVRGSAAPTISGNVVDYANNGGADTGRSQCGLELQSPDINPTVLTNIIRNAPTGVCIANAASGVLSGNELDDNNIGISILSSELEVSDNVVRGGTTGISIDRGSPLVTGNKIEGAATFGISIGGGSTATLSGNTVCGNATNLNVDQSATPDIDVSNEICEDDSAE